MRKKLFAILMSAMMMVTFMPAMAFAATPGADLPQWSDKCASVVYGYVSYSATRTFGTDGIITAKTGAINGLTTAADDNWTDGTKVVSVPGGGYGLQKKYIDLDGAFIAPSSLKTGSSDAQKAAFITEARKTATTNLYHYSIERGTTVDADVVTVAPAGFSNAGEMRILSNDGWWFDLSTIDYDTTNPYVDQTFTLTVTKHRDNVGTPVTTFGTLASKTLTILAGSVSKSDAKYNVSGANTKVANADNLTADYDGTAHVVSQVELPGVTSTYQVWDKLAGKYVATPEVSVTNATDGYAFQAKATKAATATALADSTEWMDKAVVVVPATQIVVEFDAAAYTEYYGDKFDAKEHIVFTSKKTDGTTAENKAKNAANDKALAANKALIDEYFSEFYDVTVKTNEKTHVTTATISQKEGLSFTTAQKDALITKYGQMLKNFGFTVNRTTIVAGLFGAGDTANVDLADMVEFDKAPLKLKYYNKKGKLAKSYTVTVQAHAASGAKVSYFLVGGGSQIKIDKNTGKITVKKGLKAGTYKVQVYASVGSVYGENTSVANNGYELTVQLTKKK